MHRRRPTPDPRAERTRELVIAHVRELVRQFGLHAVTPQRVADDTGVSRSTLHRHWPDFRRLLVEAVKQPDPAVETPLLGDLRLDLGVDLHQLRLRLNDRDTLAMAVSMIGQCIFDESFAAILREHARFHLERLARVLDAGRADGKLRDDIDVEAASCLLAGPLFFQRLVRGEEITPEFVDGVIDAFLAAHAAPSAATAADARPPEPTP